MKISLKAYRINANLSVKQAAEIVGVHEMTLRKWENNPEAFKCARWEHVAKLAKAYGISADDLVV